MTDTKILFWGGGALKVHTDRQCLTQWERQALISDTGTSYHGSQLEGVTAGQIWDSLTTNLIKDSKVIHH